MGGIWRNGSDLRRSAVVVAEVSLVGNHVSQGQAVGKERRTGKKWKKWTSGKSGNGWKGGGARHRRRLFLARGGEAC
jgi:hypothetical protein